MATRDDPWFRELYPDVRAEGGLRAALEARLRTLVLSPPVSYPELPVDPEFGTGAALGERSIGVDMGCEERVFVGELWEAGVVLGSYMTASLDAVAERFERWLAGDERASTLASTGEIKVAPRPWAAAHEQGTAAYVEFLWRDLLPYPYLPRVREMIQAAARVPSLRALRPFTSHMELHFSRSAGYPFSSDCPWIVPVHETEAFAVYDAFRTLLGTGTAQEAAALAAAHLPPGTGPARRGPWRE